MSIESSNAKKEQDILMIKKIFRKKVYIKHIDIEITFQKEIKPKIV